jgi:hypothetical protein
MRSSSQAVTAGASDAADPAVVALVDSSGSVLCTGTLVTSLAVLTAAHCGIDASTFPGYRAFFGSAPSTGGTFVPISGAHVHPGFDPETLANDLAILALASDPGFPPVPMLTTGAALDGATVRVVGFGLAGDAGAGAKRSGTATISAVDTTTMSLAPAPSLPCEGDSGGPELLSVGGVEYLASVTSHGDGACVTSATATRVDAFQASFIQPYLNAIAPGTAHAGARCLYPEQCAAGTCTVAADDADVAYCAPSCVSGSSCPARMSCDASRSVCVYPAPSPGALGAPCASAEDCSGSECTTLGVCSVRCVVATGDCPAGFECTAVSLVDSFCTAAATPLPVSGPSCSSAPASPHEAGRAELLIAALLIVGARARRRS